MVRGEYNGRTSPFRESAYEDADLEYSLRPQTLRQYIGQDKAKHNLEVFIEAAKMREETLDRVLLYEYQVLVKRRLRILLPMRWALMLEQLQVQLKDQEI